MNVKAANGSSSTTRLPRRPDTGSTVAEIGDNLFGDSFRCHPDGSISYLRRPVIEVELSPCFTQLEPG